MIYALVFLYFLAMFTHDRKLVVVAGCGLSILMFPATAALLMAAIFVAQLLRNHSELFRFVPYVVLIVIIVKNSAVTDSTLLVGMSFGLFQLCYYLGEKVSIGKSFAQLSFFPQLACGPVVRPQNYERRKSINDKQQFLYHILFLHGLLLKCYISFVFESLYDKEMGFLSGINFLFYLYADYLGWSLMGIAIAGLCGFKLPMNFKRPFAARSISQFYSTWNITLYYWVKTFVELPASVSKKVPNLTIFTYTTVLAIWHGMSVNFLIFGFFNMTMFLAQRTLWRKGMRRSSLMMQGLFYLSLGLVFTGQVPTTIWPKAQFSDFSFFVLSAVILFYFDSLNPNRFRVLMTNLYSIGSVVVPVLVVVVALVHPETSEFYYARF